MWRWTPQLLDLEGLLRHVLDVILRMAQLFRSCPAAVLQPRRATHNFSQEFRNIPATLKCYFILRCQKWQLNLWVPQNKITASNSADENA
jgi:hypothetical protein